MSVATQQPETDLLIPRPAPGEQWDPHTVHTHYFGFNIPDHAIGTFAYIRYMPGLGMCHAGFQAYQGIDNDARPAHKLNLGSDEMNSRDRIAFQRYQNYFSISL